MTDLHIAGPGGAPASSDTPAHSPVMGGPSTKPEDTPPDLSTGSATSENDLTGSSAAPSDSFGLSPDNRNLFEKKGWRDMNDALSSYDALSRKLGSSINPPDTNAPQEDWDAFYARLGCPKDIEGYHFSLPEGLPEDFPYDTDSANAFKGWAKQAGLNPRQADSLHGEYVRMQAEQIDRMNQDFSRKEEEAHKTLSDAWGGVGTETYNQNLSHARAALNGAGVDVENALFDAGLLSIEGDLRDASLGLWLAKLGKHYYSDDSFTAGHGAGVSTNPFMPDENGKTNLTHEAQLLKNDPDRAIALIRAAGREAEFAPYLK